VTAKHEFDDVLADAIRRVGLTLRTEAVEVGPDAIQESKHMQPALEAALRRLLGEAAVRPQKQLRFEHGEGDLPRRLGGIDIAVADSNYGWRALIELKWCPLDGLYLGWAIWDFYKMAIGRISPGADACYLVAGGPDALWAKPDTVGELFRSEHWEVGEVYRRHEKIFVGDGNDCKKFTALPARVETILVADHALASPLDPWRIKAIRIEPDPADWLALEEGRLATPQ
jgi:hypothetical protein